jgi:alpha-L-rhamnosidase
VLTQKTYPSWCFWLENGADTAWESWETTTRSQDHYFLGSYDEVFFTHFAGIKDVKDGYESFTIEPQLDCGLEYVNVSVKTPFGELISNWKITDDNTISLKITIPEGANAKVILSAKERIEENLSGGEYEWEIEK